MRAFRVFIPGEYEDAFVYMDHLLAVATDRALLRVNLSDLLDRVVPPDLRQVAYLWIERNDLLLSAGAQALLELDAVVRAVDAYVADAEASLLAPDVEWSTSEDYEVLLGDATVLDLQIYAQRLFAATTRGILHADLIDDGGDFFFSRPVKRSDARCVALAIRYGAVAASCEGDGLLMSFDEFGELREHDLTELEVSSAQSLRASWLGYNLINYVTASTAEALKARYTSVARKADGAREAVVTSLAPDQGLLTRELPGWDDADFVFNDHARFFVHRYGGRFEVHERNWRGGHLGAIVASWGGHMDRPLSALVLNNSLVIETLDRVWRLGRERVEELHQGEAVVVRTFPNSKRYRNVVTVVDTDGIHLISPFAVDAPLGPGAANRG